MNGQTQLIIFKQRPNLDELSCPSCDTTRCCVDHWYDFITNTLTIHVSCNWDDCTCGDCVLCGGTMPLELSEEEKKNRIPKTARELKNEFEAKQSNSEKPAVHSASHEKKPNVLLTQQSVESPKTIVNESKLSKSQSKDLGDKRRSSGKLKSSKQDSSVEVAPLIIDPALTLPISEQFNLAFEPIAMMTQGKSDDMQQDLDADIQLKADMLTTLIKQSNYIVIFTGPALSNSAGIPDFGAPGIREAAEN